MKKVMLLEDVAEFKYPIVARVCTIAKLFDMDRATVWKHMNRMKEAGIYDDIVIEENERTKYIDVKKFREYMGSRHLKYLMVR